MEKSYKMQQNIFHLHHRFYTNEIFENFLGNDTEVQIVNSPGKAYKQYTNLDSKDFSMNYS